MPLYETIFIARQDLTLEDVDNLSAKFAKVVSDLKGKIVSKEYWGLRNLAYPVKKNVRGHYVLFNIQSEYPAVAELERLLGFDEDVIRNLTFRVDAHEKESSLFVSVKAADSKGARTAVKKDPTKADLVLDQLQFDIN